MAAALGDDAGLKGPMDKFLRPKRGQQAPCMPQTAFRATNLCQQLLVHELGYPSQRSLSAWREVQHSQQLVQLQLPPVWHSPPSTLQRQEVCCLELQRSCSSIWSSSDLAAVGYSCGTLHLVKLADLLDTVQGAAHARDVKAAGSPDSGGAAAGAAAATAGVTAVVPVCAPVPAGCVWSVDLQDRLLSCCWAPPGGGVPELATAGAQGVVIRRLVEGRHHAYPLKLKGGAQVAKPGQVKYLDRGAAYQLVATRPDGLVLWDCRAASRAVAELPTSSTTQLLQPMPGGDVLLAAAADGQMALYDVRRMSSSSSSVINFGGNRASQQLIARYNVPARADEAAAEASGPAAGGGPGAVSAAGRAYQQQQAHDVLLSSSCSSSLGGVPFRIYPFFRDIVLNPADCNLVAYVRPDLQVGVFDLYSGKVLQQVCVAEAFGSADASVLVECQRQAAARGCWDSRGRVLYTHGLLRQCHAGSGVAQLQPTLAAVDFGSWASRQHRWDSSWAGNADIGSSSSSSGETAGVEPGTNETSGDRNSSAGCASSTSNMSSAWCGSGGGVVCRGGQVVHLPMPHHAVPTELAVGGSNGELLMGTLQGDVICVH